jgi:hypothetical protein
MDYSNAGAPGENAANSGRLPQNPHRVSWFSISSRQQCINAEQPFAAGVVLWAAAILW